MSKITQSYLMPLSRLSSSNKALAIVVCFVRLFVLRDVPFATGCTGTEPSFCENAKKFEINSKQKKKSVSFMVRLYVTKLTSPNPHRESKPFASCGLS